MIGCIELGGTKALVSAGESVDALAPPIRIATRDPQATLADIVAALASFADGARSGGSPLEAIGVASFGPLARGPHGRFTGIARTPKPGWSRIGLVDRLQDALGVPVALDTDVTAAAMAEGRYGAARGLTDFAYVTIGTGIGVGLIVNGGPAQGLGHPEAGHIAVPRAPGDGFAGLCPFHGACVEGLASGPALAARLGRPLETAAPDDPIWPLAGWYVGHLIATLALVAAPRCVVLGGGVAQSGALLPYARATAASVLADYLEADDLAEGLASYIRAPGLGGNSGLFGAFVLGAARAAAAR